MPTIYCKDCNILIDETNSVYYGKHRRNKCKKCWNEYQKVWHKEKPHLIAKIRRRSQLKFHYDLSPEIYDLMVKLQSGGCAICKEPTIELVIDHNHITNEIRG